LNPDGLSGHFGGENAHTQAITAQSSSLELVTWLVCMHTNFSIWVLLRPEPFVSLSFACLLPSLQKLEPALHTLVRIDLELLPELFCAV
jgi:hypothetical protein